MVPVVMLIAGCVFGISASTSRGSDLRSDESQLRELVLARESAVNRYAAERNQLDKSVADLQQGIAGYDVSVAAAQKQAQALEQSAGLTALTGSGVEVSLNDAPLGPNGELPPGARPDDVVIHQSDVQGVVNAMWAAGVDAVTIMGKRLINTSAVLCVGNTLLLDGKTYSPPFVIAGIGDQNAIEQHLKDEPGLDLFFEAVDAFGLGYKVVRKSQISAPAYEGALGVSVATPIG
ncbi:uncharacterized protein YlxW (UPF0749 family) [Antricoccus suffuscus]|uniref:Uncharacterized protein YlxW (UPF0749 family) n=2 Tax=Antricoccus suffuscus TaxID=1629062 RepID=A0A2T1A2D5_9ACTN|nr:uncharacterized protein YlxW (UPF0749 family) [Antricoccus suffuscus]